VSPRGPILDRALQASWLDLALALARDDGPKARAHLDVAMRDRIPAPEARAKTVQALGRIWINPPEPAADMIQWARDRSERVADARVLHIGALLAVYPFVADAWRAIGREVFLHGEVRMGAVRRRLLSIWGQREAVTVGARAAVRTLRSLGILGGDLGDSRSLPGERIHAPPALAPWMLHALCLAHGASELGAREATSAPEFFMLSLPGTFSKDYPFLERLVEGGDRTVFRVRSAHQVPLVLRAVSRPTRRSLRP
jgi:hypothetical protein